MLHEAIQALQVRASGTYADLTFGGGGHSSAILEKLNADGKLVAFDQDATALQNAPADNRLICIHQNFKYLSRYIKLHNIPKLDGVLADLGVSSHQFDVGARGFSIRFDGPLDMRMDQRSDRTAAQVLKTYTEVRLHKMFQIYGEVSNAKSLARHITEQRKFHSLDSISDFKHCIAGLVKGNPNKYLAQVFQALRIEVNEELAALEEMLEQLKSVVAPGGRIVIITFHSLEDRMVKNFFKNGTLQPAEEHPFEDKKPVSWLKVITKKPIEPTEEEVKQNPRSRSARLRVAESVEI
jgi:16S rRNA (cytosine1402-N4)-methyltransferase